ncbi:endonuclease/exonuclease/phosphatase family protein [Streptomyces sp. NPDC018057]|uniref:endonuclease/exonuclease/phosphatase family protein n=1 Tax=unclassified Streptomyces TaxID=2593676 RepID=UPI0037BAD88D
MSTLDVLTFNLNNPGRERAARQLAYLAARPEQVLVLTETADSAGCDLLASRFEAAGFSVTYPRPGRGERGVMVVSRLAVKRGAPRVTYLPHRCVSVWVDTVEGPVEVLGLYVPSRDAREAKKARKAKFLHECLANLPPGGDGMLRLVMGDFNILEPDHVPRYRFFQDFEYEFYRGLGEAGYRDAFRALHPDATEYSWVGRTGDGYRYDHAHASRDLARELRACEYVHEVRTPPDHLLPRLTDHSPLTVSIAVQPYDPLDVTTPEPVTESTALF